jgi:nitrate reductase gamma subunit
LDIINLVGLIILKIVQRILLLNSGKEIFLVMLSGSIFTIWMDTVSSSPCALWDDFCHHFCASRLAPVAPASLVPTSKQQLCLRRFFWFSCQGKTSSDDLLLPVLLLTRVNLGIFTFDHKTFPTPKSLNAELHAMDFHSVWMIDPGVKAETGYFVYDQVTDLPPPLFPSCFGRSHPPESLPLSAACMAKVSSLLPGILAGHKNLFGGQFFPSVLGLSVILHALIFYFRWLKVTWQSKPLLEKSIKDMFGLVIVLFLILQWRKQEIGGLDFTKTSWLKVQQLLPHSSQLYLVLDPSRQGHLWELLPPV